LNWRRHWKPPKKPEIAERAAAAATEDTGSVTSLHISLT
jgi:hypothetical protein